MNYPPTGFFNVENKTFLIHDSTPLLNVLYNLLLLEEFIPENQ